MEEPLKCDTNCDPCEGAVRPVIVSGEKWEPTEFNYCDNAVELDRKNGFTVKEITNPPVDN